MNMHRLAGAAAALAVVVSAPAFAQSLGYGPYQPRAVMPASDASYVLADGSIHLVADQTMGPLLDRLNRLFIVAHPQVRFTMTLRPPPTGIDGITAGVSLLAPVAHDAGDAEIEPLKRLTGSTPLDIRIGHLGHSAPGRDNPPAAYVNAASPLREIDMETLARVFTAGAVAGDLRRWNQLGVGGDWARHAIHVYGTRDDGGFITTLRGKVFGRRPFARHYEALPADADVLEAVEADRYAIGLASFVDPASISAQVRMLAITQGPGTSGSRATYEDVQEGRYTLVPDLHFYVREVLGKRLDPLAREYVRLALSTQGQTAIAELRDGLHAYVPLNAEEAKREVAKLERP